MQPLETPQQIDEPARTILHILASHIGPKHAITRGELLTLVNAELDTEYASDRAIRNAIEELRSTHKDGAFICANYPSDGEPGYFLARDEDEAREFMKPDYARANNLLSRLASQERLLNKSKSPQIGMPL